MDEAQIEQGSEGGVSRLDQRVERQLTLGDCSSSAPSGT